VHYTKISSEFEFGGQRSKFKVTRDKNEKVRHFFGSGPRGLELCRPPVLYDGGKISACCLVFRIKRFSK